MLRWNDAEDSWDCPLHGSRFTAAGTLLEGPATTDLRRLRFPPDWSPVTRVPVCVPTRGRKYS
ncbi:Rieske 2Fe-2S domain-containing protein [Rhodococcus sp. T2V]|uniref:Rieske 2Fe-2S domain-containing protein n=1 Tax=Rhodococcus sp. T2V TaxID=3034164 RepID=UPI0023E14C9E|nr:Rieske 2Fe-2S domain-containing protein [Rhodococcus sp. T2V]MDF3312787.1 Rieske 2Fe-2S domain-containing protein [Rhodococcus sp. T2V]